MRTTVTLLMLLLFVPFYAQRSEKQGWIVKNYNESDARNYFDNNYYLDKVEGIWQSTDGFKYAIEKDIVNNSRSQNRFRVIILESSVDGWAPTEIKGFIDYGSINSVYSMKYYTKNLYTGSDLSSQNVLLIFESPLVMSFQLLDGNKITLYKLYPKVENISSQQPQESVESAEWTGTCFAIGLNLVATNYHVVENAQTLVVSGVNGDKNTNYKAEVILTDKYNDLAVMRITDYRFKGFDIKYGMESNVADIGTEVFVLGYPLTTTMGEDIKLTTGVISSKTGFQGDVSLYQTSAPIQPGNSGGPLFNNKGNLIGIVNAKHKGAENVGYAIKLSYLKNLLDSSNETIPLNSVNTISSLPLTGKVKAITSCVLLVKANTQSIGTNNRNNNIQKGIASENEKMKAQSLLESSQTKYQNEDYNGAYQDACESVRLYPTPISQYMRGYLALFYTNDEDVAIEALEYCLKKNYNNDACISLLARCYMSKKDYANAISYLNKAIDNDRKDVHSLELRGICKSEIGKREEAIRDYMQAIKFDGIVDYDYSNLYNNIAFEFMNQKKYEEAKEHIEKALKHNHLYGNAWDTYGEINYHTGYYEECIKCMNIAITNGRTYDGAKEMWMGNSYLYRGLAKKKLGNLAGAYKDLEKAVELEEDSASNELAKIDASTIDFSEDQSFNNMITYPTIRKKGDSDMQIQGVEICDEFTALHLFWNNTKYDNGYYTIERDAYIRNKSTGKKYRLIATENCAISPQKTPLEKGGVTSFTLYFESIPQDTKEIDFIESNKSNWKYYGIKLEQ